MEHSVVHSTVGFIGVMAAIMAGNEPEYFRQEQIMKGFGFYLGKFSFFTMMEIY